MLRQGDSNGGDFFHQILTDAMPLLFHGSIGIKPDGFSEVHLLQLGSNVEGYEGNRLSGFLVIQLCHIDEAVLKIIEDVVMLHIMLREDHNMIPLLKPLYRIFEGADQPGVMVDTDGVGIVEHHHGERCNEVGQQLKPRMGPFGLLGPEIPESILRNIFQVHHLPCAPGKVLSGAVQLSTDGAVHLGVVAHDDAGLPGKILPSDGFYFGIEKGNSTFDKFVQQGFFLLRHKITLPIRSQTEGRNIEIQKP